MRAHIPEAVPLIVRPVHQCLVGPLQVINSLGCGLPRSSIVIIYMISRAPLVPARHLSAFLCQHYLTPRPSRRYFRRLLV